MKTENHRELALEATTLWDFPKQNYGNKPHGDNKFNGVTPALVIWNLLQRYTKEGDLVVDPMCGSGTTIDVAKELNRRVIGFDIAPYRKDIKKADARKLPLEAESSDFVFIDSPYSDNVRYSDEPNCIGKISCETEDFFVELDKVAREIYRVLKPGGSLGWVIGDQWKKKVFIPVGIRLYGILEKYFEPADLVCLTRRNQTSNTPFWLDKAREHNFFLRGFKYLFIMKK